ncbi:MAG TPA: methionyl-tRNA formyltransferase [Bradyrhizobium sp.]|nr:methionyl-tRNA formyltransferase [Bradyrhizobium sp.]
MPLRLIFMGTPEFAVPTLRLLDKRGHQIVAVYTRPPKPRDRLKLQPTPIETEGRRLGVPVRTPSTLRAWETLQEFRSYHADAAVVVAYGLILPREILDAPKFGCFNLHASLLPRWRGAAPIERAIMAGDNETGVMVMKMDAGLDTGDIALAEPVQITDGMTDGELRHDLAELGAKLMVRVLDDLEYGKVRLIRQSAVGESYAKKIDKTETHIDWDRPARLVLRHVHALSPSPAAWCEMPIGGQLIRVKILRCELANGAGLPGELLDDRLTVACGQGAIRILELQKAGGSPIKAKAFQAGARLRPPAHLL